MSQARELADVVSSAPSTDFNVDSGTLFVDNSENRVGIGTTTPSVLLHLQRSSTTAYSSTATTNDSTALIINSGNGGHTTLEFQYSSSGTGQTGQATISSFNEPTLESSGTKNTALTFGTKQHSDSTIRERMRISSDGNVLIGSSTNVGTADHKVSIDIGSTGRALGLGTSATSEKVLVSFVNGNGTVGSINASGTGIAYNTTSDYRLKENVTPLTGAINRLNQLKPSRFNFIADPDITIDGFLAHEVSDYVPEAVNGEKDAVDENGDIDPQKIDQSKLVPLLIASVQELSKKVTTLENALN